MAVDPKQPVFPQQGRPDPGNGPFRQVGVADIAAGNALRQHMAKHVLEHLVRHAAKRLHDDGHMSHRTPSTKDGIVTRAARAGRLAC
jgi:hypothetical protein